MVTETCQDLSEHTRIEVEASAPAEFSMEFTSHVLHQESTAVLRACGGASAVLVVSEHQPTPADEALWDNLEGHRKSGLLRATTRVRLPPADHGLSGVTAVVREAAAAGLARRDVFVTCGNAHTAQVTTLAAAMFRRHTDAVQVVTDLPALASLLSRGWNATLDREPVSMPLLRVTAVVDADSLLTGPALTGPAERAALRSLAALLPGIRNVARQLERSDSVALRRELLDVLRCSWQNGLLVPGAGPLSRPPAHNAVRITRPLSFPVLVGGGVFDPERSALASQLPPDARVFAVVDGYSAAIAERIASVRRAGQVRSCDVQVLVSSPVTKTLSSALRVVDHAARLRLCADDRIIAVGGGTVMDIVGFAAALYGGATPYVRVPTTLVGLVDAGVGFKVGVDAEGRRNLIGAYHPPVACLCDPEFLTTLPGPGLRCGLAEMIKIAAIKDRELFELIERSYGEVLARRTGANVTRMISGSIEAMVTDLAANPMEAELRRLPDFGHEFGHLLETASHLRLRHGEAVAIGMALACEIAVEVGWLDPADCSRILALIQAAGLPVFDTCCDPAALWRGLSDDVVPHKNGSLNLTVPTGIGTGGFIGPLDAVSEPILERVCHQLRARAENPS
jgi:2-epi-5-epi-valiolone synthase